MYFFGTAPEGSAQERPKSVKTGCDAFTRDTVIAELAMLTASVVFFLAALKFYLKR
jgi:hypothetical protein